MRRLFEQAARERPLVVAVEDVHWAEPTPAGPARLPRRVLARAADPARLPRAAGAARERDRRGRRRRPAARRTCSSAARRRGGPGARARRWAPTGRPAQIVDTAEGNPLFLEQLVAVGAEGEALPPTIHAVLAARIDRLEPGERAVLLRASVEGRTFHAGARCCPRRGRRRCSSGSSRKQLIRVDRPQLRARTRSASRTRLCARRPTKGCPSSCARSCTSGSAAGWHERPEAPEEIVAFNLEQAYRSASRARNARRRRSSATSGLGAWRARPAPRSRAATHAPAPAAGAGGGARRTRPASLLPRLGAALFEAGRLADADRVLARGDRARRAGGDEHSRRWRVSSASSCGSSPTPARRRARARAEIADAALEVLAVPRRRRAEPRAWCLRAATEWTAGRARAG